MDWAPIFVFDIKKIQYEIIFQNQIKITQNRDSQKIQLDWASIFVFIMLSFPYENNTPNQININQNTIGLGLNIWNQNVKISI